MFQLAQVYLLKFYTDALGISAYWGEVIFLVTKFVDAITDTLVGTWVDSRKIGPRGKFKPFILFSSPFLAIATIAAFLAPDLNEAAKVVYAFLTYNLMSLAYTVVNVPHGSLSSSMTTDSVQRTSLSVFRNLGTQVGILATGTVVVPIVNAFGSPATVAIFAVLGILCHIITYKETEERFISKKERVKGDGKKALSYLFKTGLFWVLSAYTILSIGGMFLKIGFQLYYFEYALGQDTLVSFVSILNMVALLPALFLSSKLVAMFGKKNLAVLGTGGFAIFEFVNYFFTGDQMTTFLIVNLFSYFFLSLANTVAFAFVADVMEYTQWKFGLRSEGITYSAYSFVRKIAQGFAGFLPGAALTAIGYVANQQQTAETLSGMATVYFLVPAVMSIAAVLIFGPFYKLTDKRHAEITQELQERGELYVEKRHKHTS